MTKPTSAKPPEWRAELKKDIEARVGHTSRLVRRDFKAQALRTANRKPRISMR
jgi:hypothetical protein